MTNEIVSHDRWLEARIELLKKEKQFLRLRDELSQTVRSLPHERLRQDYVFEGEGGPIPLSGLFGPNSQLIVYHFMFGEDSSAGCPSCSFVTDSLAPTVPHLAARDVTLVLVSRAPLQKLIAYKMRMAWKLNWVSSLGNQFNQDFQASTDVIDSDGKYYYNYDKRSLYPPGEQPGLSVFTKTQSGQVLHTYSTYARGLEAFVGTYSLLNVVPKGRNEGALDWPMAWVRRRDEYVSPDSNRNACCK